MRKLGVAFVLLLVIALAGPGLIGSMAEQRVNRSLDQLIEAAPYLGIVERNYTSGWFRSEQEVTFEVLAPWPAQTATAVLERLQPGLRAPRRFTVRNEFLHGPVLGFSGIGLARVETHFVLSEAARRDMVRTFGTDEPLRIRTRIGFFGSSTTSLYSEARTLALPDDPAEVSWDELRISATYSHDFGEIDVVGDWPRVERRNPVTRERFVMRDLRFDLESERVLRDLYDTDIDLAVKEVSYVPPNAKVTRLRDLHFVVDSRDDGDFTSIVTRFGTGEIVTPELETRGIPAVESVHYDFSLRRLHTETLADLMSDIKDSYHRPVRAASLTDNAFALLRHDPELVIDRVGLVTADGELVLQGFVRLRGVTGQDLGRGPLPLLGKLEVELKFEAPQRLVDKLRPGSAVQMVSDGFAELKGDKVVGHLEFRAGELRVNGKVQGIPGLGRGGPPFGREAGGAGPE